jgi:hypothetical protein
VTCTRIPGGIVCTSPWGRLHVSNRYIWVDYHAWCGPSFSYDSAGNIPYVPVDENDPVWLEFSKWLKKYDAAKAKQDGKTR